MFSDQLAYLQFERFLKCLEEHGRQAWLIKVMQRLAWTRQQMVHCFNKDLTQALVKCYGEMLQSNLDAGQLLYVYMYRYIMRVKIPVKLLH